jgi:hypothetical protein
MVLNPFIFGYELAFIASLGMTISSNLVGCCLLKSRRYMAVNVQCDRY